MKLALLQTLPRHDITANLDLLNIAAGRAAAEGAALLLTPEMFLTGYAIGPAEAKRLAMMPDDPVLGRVAEIARDHGIGILTGFPEHNGAERPFNSIRLFGRDGATVTTYRKSHLWPVVDNTQFSRGECLSDIVAFEGWQVALAICYDIEFPELARALRLAGADLILVPTAAPAPFSSVSTRIVPTRAEENAMYIAYCNFCGSEDETTYFGMSTVCGPDGSSLSLADAKAEGLSFATLDQATLAETRKALHHIEDRRPDLYGALVQ